MSADLYIMESIGKTNPSEVGMKRKNAEPEESKAYTIVEIIEYMANAVISKTIIKKLTWNSSSISFDRGEGLTEKISPFDTFTQIIKGETKLVIAHGFHLQQSGMGIVIPAHLSNYIKLNGRYNDFNNK